MDNLETKSGSTNGPSDLAERCAALQRQSTVLLIGLVVLSGTLLVFLGLQSHYAGVDLEGAKAQLLPVLQNYKQNEKPSYEKVEAQLAEYARTHPDFAQLLNQYRIQVAVTPLPTATPSTSVAVPPKSTVPATSPPPKSTTSAPVKK